VRRWESIILRYAVPRGIDPDLVAAIMMVESAGDSNAVSYAGAIGLMQVMPYHPQDFPNRPAAYLLYDPAFNLQWGVSILAANIEWAQGDLALALGAYYGGRAHSLAGSAGTRAYAQKVLNLYWAARSDDV
jgi:soluble lytic murein transglycosylase-like protein